MASISFVIISSILGDFLDYISNDQLILNFIALLVCLTISLLASHLFISKTSRKVFLLDFACYKPPDAQKCSREKIAQQLKLMTNCSKDMFHFMENVLEKAGIGDSTYVAKGLLETPPNMSMEAARQEAMMAMFGAIDNLLTKTSAKCKDIDMLIVNCSIFNVVPSLSSMIVHRYKLRENIASYNLSGMGCGAGLIAINLARQLLQVHHSQYALVVSTEPITRNIYKGKERAKFLTNCLFRTGGAAILLSNHSSDSKSSKYELIHVAHNNFANCDLSYNSINQEEDQEGLLGITLSQDLSVVARNAITSHLTQLGPSILPLSEKIKFLIHSLTTRNQRFSDAKFCRTARAKKYVPKFEKCINHIFPHAGGRRLLDDFQKALEFSDGFIEPARMTLHKFGNTSSSTIWYSKSYAEAKGRIKKGHLTWQIAFGAGFYCTSVVWRATRDVGLEEINPWGGDIDEYPLCLDA